MICSAYRVTADSPAVLLSQSRANQLSSTVLSMELSTFLYLYCPSIEHMDVANVTEELNSKFYLIMINLYFNCYMWLQYWILQINTEIFESKDHLCFPKH